ncbi:MAG: hypothetical protein MK135_06535, partial [Polyangiaceae bacterium]|nr:hypothetical protein [Polyangiaceae bacterium]
MTSAGIQTELAPWTELPQENGRVTVVSPSNLGAMGQWALARSFLWVELEAPGPEYRGRLDIFIEEAIEASLLARGAVPPGFRATTGLDAILSDQLYRARLVELKGIALGIPSLEGIANRGRTIDADDSAVLRWWMAAAAERDLRLVVSDENSTLRVYPSPVSFESLYEIAPQKVTPRPPALDVAASVEAMELSDLPPAVEETLDSEEAQGSGSEDGESAPVGMSAASVAESALIASAQGPETLEAPAEEVAFSLADNVDLPDLDRALGLGGETQTEQAESLIQEDKEEKLAVQIEANTSALEMQKALPGQGEQLAINYCPESTRRTDVLESAAAVVDSLDEAEFLDEFSGEPSASAQPELDDTAAAESAPLAPTPLPTKVIGREKFSATLESSNPVFEEENSCSDVNLSVDSTLDSDKVNDDLSSQTSLSRADQGGHDTGSETQPATSQASDREDAFDALAKKEWRSWFNTLEAAQGPKPLSVIERHFVTEYTRLREARRRGWADERVDGLLNSWSGDFEQSYSGAFDSLRVRGKRPTMVLDIPDVAARFARLQGARRTHLLMVDSLRFDLGLMVQDRLRGQIDAALTERLLLWSALPSVTSYQLELIGQGASGLKEAPNADAEDVL